jgi:2-iminobutanoate/2-iminopropanoate deaminase
MKKILKSDKCPAAVGPYSQAVQTGNLIFMSGQIPIDVNTGKIVESDIEKQTRCVLNNIKSFVTDNGLSLNNIIKNTIFVRNIKDFDIINSIYSEYFTENFPARSLVEVSGLPKNVLIEIESIVCID